VKNKEIATDSDSKRLQKKETPGKENTANNPFILIDPPAATVDSQEVDTLSMEATLLVVS